ncbi:uncharacterized protein [Spinacia oleracea]|uniref:Endonuclease/exonuclease/phosphatase domain-containing protein n=1 Tax=Spinacia oleracea TaxID=3562 RepID=A0ABM3QJZ4_SPIOL|nr:uncharacterized protein LOC130460048 [Spinacia oleracea]
MIICSWNVKGLNDPSKVVEVKKILSRHNISVIAIIETRRKEGNAQRIQNKFGSAWLWEMNYTCSPKGRIWIGWKHNRVNFQLIRKTDQTIHGDLSDKDGLFSVCFTAVYGLHTIEHRRPLWNELVNLSAVLTKPWLIMGDFNSVLFSGDRVNGNPVQIAETKDFEECIQAAGITELKSCGNMFSWSNKGQGDQRISSRIDRAFGCCDWQSIFTEVCVDYLNPGISDHSPLLLDCNIAHHQGSRPFKFFNYMASHERFRQVVQEGWDTPVVGTAMFQVWQKLKAVKKGLKHLHHKHLHQSC